MESRGDAGPYGRIEPHVTYSWYELCSGCAFSLRARGGSVRGDMPVAWLLAR